MRRRNKYKHKHKWHVHKSKHEKKIKIPYKKIILPIAFVLCLTLIGLSIITNKNFSKTNKVAINKNNINSNENNFNFNKTPFQTASTSSNDSNITNIALFGIDEIEGTEGRSDCIIILTIDTKNNKIKLSSIIRDSYVIIPKINKKDKINHAYAFGGYELALQTLNENFNLNLDKVIVVNFSSLPKIIDTFGGVQLNITKEELKYINNYIDNINELNHTNSPNIVNSGNQLIDGTQALAYCRIRYTTGGDFERTKRQRTLLSKLIEKCSTIPITEYPSMEDKIFPLIYTNLEKSKTLSLALHFGSFSYVPILQERFPNDEDGSGKLIDGIYYFVFNKEITTKKMHEFIFS